MNRCVAVLAVMVLVAGAWLASAKEPAPPKEPKEPNAFMQLKLKNSQMVLEGIAVRDFKLIETSAETLIILSKKSEFMLMKTPDYERHSDAFRRNAETLVKMAKEKNLDGAALTYLQLTMNCVDCHKHVREVK